MEIERDAPPFGAGSFTLARFKIPKTLAVIAAWGFGAVSKIAKKEPFISRSKVEFLTCDHGSDISKAESQLGYKPIFEFKDGVQRTVDWYYEHHLL